MVCAEKEWLPHTPSRPDSHHIASQAHKAFLLPRAREELPTVTQNSLCGSAAYCCTNIVRILPHPGPARKALLLADDAEKQQGVIFNSSRSRSPPEARQTLFCHG
jgi:hypothetical protein